MYIERDIKLNECGFFLLGVFFCLFVLLLEVISSGLTTHGIAVAKWENMRCV